MPPKANKPAAPKKPTKPSAKSKTGNTACSQAASNWQLSIRGKEPLDPQTYATLAKCRAMTRTAKQADDRARMGYNLNDQGAAALKGRLQKRFDQGLITQKSRDERLKMLLQQRKEKQAAVAAKPADKAASLVSSVRQKPGYGVARASAAGNRELVGLKMRNKGQVTTQPAFTLKQSSSQGGTGAGRSMGVLFQTEGTALDKAAQAGQKAPLAGQTGLFGSENQTGKPPKYVLEAGFTTWKQVNKFGLNNIVKDAPSIAKAAVDPTRNKYAGGSRDWIENDIASRIVKLTRIHGNKQLAIKAVAREYELQSQRQQEAGMPEVYKSISSELYKSSDLYNYKLNSQSQPPKPFSRGGQLAPGRGTEQRRRLAATLINARNNRKTNAETKALRSEAASLLVNLRTSGNKIIASEIRDKAVVSNWKDETSLRKRRTVLFSPREQAKRIIDAAKSVRGRYEQTYSDAQFAAKSLLTPTGKFSSANASKNIRSSIHIRYRGGSVLEGAKDYISSQRKWAQVALSRIRAIKQAGGGESYYVSKPESFKGKSNYLSQFRTVISKKS